MRRLVILEPVNLICLMMVEMAALLTWDRWLALSGFIAEAAYVLVAPKTKWVRKLPERRATLDRLNVALLVVAIAGVMIISFAGFLKHLLSNPLPTLTHSQTWEFCAVFWTILFLVYYFCKWKMTTNQKKIIVLLAFALFSFLASLVVLNWGLAWPYPYLSSEYLHVFLIALGTFFMLLIDFVLWKKGGDRDERMRSRQSFWIADVPVFMAFVVLLVCLLRDKDNEHPDAFFGGAVSFQLVLSNILFIVTEFNLLGVSPEEHRALGATPPVAGPIAGAAEIGAGLPIGHTPLKAAEDDEGGRQSPALHGPKG